uniref:E3 ubiquitin-protein ligase RNF170 n=1 Tax=Capitella teleta TaxID=283909 RepID=X1YV84_CAPTE
SFSQNAEQRIHPESEQTVHDVRERRHATERPPPSAPSTPSQSFNQERTCPICLAGAEFAIETNCGHLFCGECMVTYWRHGRWLGTIRCPVCRQQVTLMLKNFTSDENRLQSPQKDQVIQEVNHYNRRFSGQPIPWMDYIRDLPTILRHCFRHFFSVGGLLLMFRIRILVCFLVALLYLISPFDIIPEAVFGILGLLDDFFILLLLAIYISIIYRRFVANQATGAS